MATASSAPTAAGAPRTSSSPAAGFPIPVTTSSCTTEIEEGSHLFEVNRYERLKARGVGKFVKSGTFDVGGYSWALLFYPAGSDDAPGGKHHVAVYLQLVTPNVEARAMFDLRLMDQSNGEWHSLFGGDRSRPYAEFSTFPTNLPLHLSPRCWGVPFWKGSNLETPAYITNGSLTIRCDITVILPPRVSETEPGMRIEAPPPSMPKDFRRLLEEKDGRDVTVRVRGKAFRVHWAVLAARSPVLRKKLLDAATDETKPPSSAEITMDDDMEPEVFMAMLHFMYIDNLPTDAKVRGDGGDETVEFAGRLFIAAEGCGMESLKQLCESILGRNLSKRTLKATTEFAVRHRCDKLRAACVQFHAAAAGAAYSAASCPAAGLPTLTMSSCTSEMAEGRHVFDFDLLKDLDAGKFIKSDTFDVGGYIWALRFYPAGYKAAPPGQDHFSACLQLLTPNVEARAFFDLGLMDKSTGRFNSLFGDRGDMPRRSAVFSTFPNKLSFSGVPSWKEFNLEPPAYIENNSLTISCDILLVMPPRVSETMTLPQIQAPPPSMPKDFRRLLEMKDGKEVTVLVRGEAFPAHRTVLAARSPVLRKKFRDAATDETWPVEISMDDDMEPAVFKAMLHFMYTDELPPDAEGRDDGSDEAAEVVRRLFIAADGCGIESLKGVCESLLCRKLNRRTLKATMEFAERHHCYRLREACLAVLGNLQRGWLQAQGACW